MAKGQRKIAWFAILCESHPPLKHFPKTTLITTVLLLLMLPPLHTRKARKAGKEEKKTNPILKTQFRLFAHFASSHYFSIYVTRYERERFRNEVKCNVEEARGGLDDVLTHFAGAW